MRSMAWLKGLPTSLIWPAHFARAEGDRAAQPMAQPRPSIAPELMCRRPFHAPRLGKGFTSQPGWTLGSAALRHRGGAGPCLSARLQVGSCVTPPVAAAESHRASLSFPSDNGKTGPIAVSSTNRQTCPSSCPLAGDQGCYAEAGFHTRLHWDRLSRGESGFPAAAFIKQVMALPAGILFRNCVARDQWPDPADPLRFDQALRLAAAKGLVVNASTESRSRAAALLRQGIPAVCVVPPDAPAVFRHEGVRFVACPASRSGRRVQCISSAAALAFPSAPRPSGGS